MNSKNVLAKLAGLLALVGLSLQLSTFAQNTAFTYQGRLNAGAIPATGSYDIRFAIYSSDAGGMAVAGPLTNSAISVSDGIFSALLDFGTGVFTGPDRWLEIAVRTNGGSAFTALMPRQPLSSVPYALYAPNAGNASTASSVPAANITGTLPLSRLPPSVLTNTNAVSKSGDTMTGTLNVATEGGPLNPNMRLEGSVGGGTTISSSQRLHVQADGTLYLNPFTPLGDVSIGGGHGNANLNVTGTLNVGGTAAGGSFINSAYRLHINAQGNIYLNPFTPLGDVIVGGGSGNASLIVTGDASVRTLTIRGGADVAEPFRMSVQEIPKGSIVIIDEDNAGQLKLSDHAYDKRVTGIVSGANGIQPGLSLSQEGVLEGYERAQRGQSHDSGVGFIAVKGRASISAQQRAHHEII